MHIFEKIGYKKNICGGKVKKMRSLFRYRACLFFCFCLAAVFLPACAQKSKTQDAASPEEALQNTMAALRDLDLETLNANSDNYIRTNRNWIGIPTDYEYRVFNELLQNRFMSKKRYMARRRLDKKLTECLSWVVNDVRKNKDYAEIDMEITNKNMSDVMGFYEIDLMKDMIRSEGAGLKQMVQDIAVAEDVTKRMISYIDRVEGNITFDVTVSAFKKNGVWKIHLDDDFINAFMGNMDSGDYSEEIEKQLADLEGKYEEKMEQWGEAFGDKIEEEIEWMYGY